MSMKTPSRDTIATLADVIDRINRRVDLSSRRRQDLTSAVRRFCRDLGCPPQELLADAADLRRRLARLSPLSAGLSPGSLRNLKSLVGKALIAAGIVSVPGRSRTPLAPNWRRLLGLLDPGERYLLSRFARWCTQRGIPPEDVDDDVMANFAQALLSHSLVGRPKQIHRNSCLAWNKASDTVEGWPRRKLTAPNHRRNYALSWSTFPASFRNDVDAFLRHLSGEDLLAETTRNPASPETLKSRRKQILAIASAVVQAEWDPRTLCSLADLVNPDAARTALNVFWERNNRRKTGHIHNLALLLVNIGRHWVKLGPDDLEQLRVLRRRVDPGKTGLTDGNRIKLLQFGDPTNPLHSPGG
jgi:hypothetical protein